MQVEDAAFGAGTHRVVDPADPPRDLSGLAWGAFVCLGLMVLLGLVRLLAAVDVRSTVIDGGDIVGDYDTYSRWTSFHALLLLITAGVFIAWFFQAYKNLRRLGVQNMRYGNGWAIGSWFVPILSLFRPKQMANDIWRGSERGVETSAGWKTVAVPGLVHWWWGLFLLQGLLLYIGEQNIESGYKDLFTFGQVSNGVSQIKTGTTFDLLGGILSIIAAMVAIVVVSQVTQRLDEIRDDALAQAAYLPQYAQAQYAQPQYAQPQYSQAPPAPQYPQSQPPPYQAPAVPQHPTYPPQSPPQPPQHAQPQTPPPPPAPVSAPPPPTPPPATTEQLIQCPDCAEWIQPQANVCRFCGHRLRPLGQ